MWFLLLFRDACALFGFGILAMVAGSAFQNGDVNLTINPVHVLLAALTIAWAKAGFFDWPREVKRRGKS